MRNWVKISRDLRRHWIFSDAEYLKWWFDIICEASWDDTKQLVGSRLVELKRGQFIASLSYLCDRWHRSRSKVEPFLKMLIEDGMITKTVSHNISILTVVNYNQYQDSEDADVCAIANKSGSIRYSNISTQADAHLCADLDAHPKCTNVQKADAHLCTYLPQSKSDIYASSATQADAHLCADLDAHPKCTNVQKADAHLCTYLPQSKSDIYASSATQADAHLCADLDAHPCATINKEDKEVKKDITVKNKQKVNEVTFSRTEQMFEDFRKAYPGRKRSHDTEFAAFKRKYKNWSEIVPLLMPAIQRLITYKAEAEAAGQWTANYANLSTWLYQARWEDELPEITSKQSKQQREEKPQQAVCDYEEEDAAFASKNK